MKVIKKVILLLFVVNILVGCAAENKHHGVAEPIWKQLTAEQKQLLIDSDLKKSLVVAR